MSAGQDVWAEGAEVVEVVLSWRDARSQNVLGVKQVKSGAQLALGERGDMMVPEEVLGAERVSIVRYDGDVATAIVPAGAKLRVDGWAREEAQVEIERGHVVELHVGAFVARMTRVTAASRPARAPLEGLKRGGFGIIAASALAHAAAFAVIAYVSPALGATEDDPYDPDRLALMQHMLNAQATPEPERTPDDNPVSTGGDVNSGKPAAGAEGAAGKPETDNKNGRWAAKGQAKPEDATLPRERELAAAANFGLLGILATSFQSDPNAPIVPWGTQLNGSDDVNKVGHLYGGTLEDAFGVGGLGFSGGDQGGGGTANAIGLNGIGGLGHTGKCLGAGPCDGIGVGYGKPGGGYHPKQPRGPRYGNPAVNGRLPPEVIQRIVRQNDGRYRFCYQNALKANPNLEGRVTVKFVIDRTGAVAIAADGGSDMPDGQVRQCVVSSFTSLSFPPPDSGTVTVVYPLVFNPE
ncbi:MAG TPA: AgmX/PglI C-terminal domain-containing protein [Polyangiaceae bacterium]|jgi:hypothetical protein